MTTTDARSIVASKSRGSIMRFYMSYLSKHGAAELPQSDLFVAKCYRTFADYCKDTHRPTSFLVLAASEYAAYTAEDIAQLTNHDANINVIFVIDVLPSNPVQRSNMLFWMTFSKFLAADSGTANKLKNSADLAVAGKRILDVTGCALPNPMLVSDQKGAVYYTGKEDALFELLKELFARDFAGKRELILDNGTVGGWTISPEVPSRLYMDTLAQRFSLIIYSKHPATAFEVAGLDSRGASNDLYDLKHNTDTGIVRIDGGQEAISLKESFNALVKSVYNSPLVNTKEDLIIRLFNEINRVF